MAHTRFASTPDIMRLPALDDWVLMVNIARQCGAPVLLPRALAVCCRHLQPSSLVLNNATKEKLSLEDRALIADASQKLSQSLRETVHQPIYYPMQEELREHSDLSAGDCKGHEGAGSKLVVLVSQKRSLPGSFGE